MYRCRFSNKDFFASAKILFENFKEFLTGIFRKLFGLYSPFDN